ncbi:hypothetical protein EBT31_17270 [bacterium]|jgi:hypothetical protein|nr:hypothetical protein [bacterium]
MAMVANDPAAAKRVGIPQSVGQEFMKADKGKKFSGGPTTRPEQQRVNKPKTQHGASALFSRGGDMKESKAMVGKELAFMKKKGAPKSMIKHEAAEMGAMKRGGYAKKMASGGLAAGHKSADGIAKKGKTKAMQVTMRKGGKC